MFHIDGEGWWEVLQDEKTQLAIDCATQHIREFLAQSTNKEMAHFGNPCGGGCKVWREGRCKDFDWLGNMDPIFRQSNVRISASNAGVTNRI